MKPDTWKLKRDVATKGKYRVNIEIICLIMSHNAYYAKKGGGDRQDRNVCKI